jgi:hypothetical protein
MEAWFRRDDLLGTEVRGVQMRLAGSTRTSGTYVVGGRVRPDLGVQRLNNSCHLFCAFGVSGESA